MPKARNLREAILLCIIKFVYYIMYRQYITYIKTRCNNYNQVIFGYMIRPQTAIFRPTNNNTE